MYIFLVFHTNHPFGKRELRCCTKTPPLSLNNTGFQTQISKFRFNHKGNVVMSCLHIKCPSPLVSVNYEGVPIRPPLSSNKTLIARFNSKELLPLTFKLNDILLLKEYLFGVSPLCVLYYFIKGGPTPLLGRQVGVFTKKPTTDLNKK